jgi:hypothetical protein
MAKPKSTYFRFEGGGQTFKWQGQYSLQVWNTLVEGVR